MSKKSQHRNRSQLAAWYAGFSIQRQLDLKQNRARFSGFIEDEIGEGLVNAVKHREKRPTHEVKM